MKRFILILVATLVCHQFTNGQISNYEQAVAYYKDGEYSKALPLFNSVIIEEPTNPFSYYYRGKIYMKLKENEAALNDFNMAQKYSNPTIDQVLPFAHLEKGRLYWMCDDAELAVVELDLAIALKPDLMESYLIRAQTLSELKRYKESEADYRYLIAYNDTVAMYHEGLGRSLTHQKRYQEAEKSFNTSIKLDPYDPWQYFYRAILYNQQVKYKEAIDDFIKFYALNFDLSTLDTFIEIAQHDLEYCIKKIDLQTVNTEQREDRDLWFLLENQLYENARDYFRAAQAMMKVIENSKTKVARAYEAIAINLFMLDLQTRVIAYYEEAIAINPDLEIRNVILGKSYLETKNWQKAITHLSKAIATDSTRYELYNDRAWAYTKTKNYALALADYNYSLALDPININGLLYRGRLYQNVLNKPELANQDFKTLFTIDTLKNSSIIEWKAFALQMIGQNNEAIKTIENLTYLPDNVTYYNAACLYSLMNKPKEALDNLNKAFELGYVDFIHCDSDDDLDNIRELPQYSALMAKYRHPYETMLNEELGKVGMLVMPKGGR